MVRGLKMRRASGFTSNKTKFAAREKLGGFKADICSSSLVWGPERKQPGLLCQGASCLNLCQLICRCGLIARRTSQPLQPNGTVICRFISQLAAKTWWHRTSESRKEEEGGRDWEREGKVKPNPRDWSRSSLLTPWSHLKFIACPFASNPKRCLTLPGSHRKLFNCLTFLCFYGAGEQFNMF